jgi:hypothetical protein
MSPEKLAVLRSLAMRPSPSLPASMLPIVVGLQQGGYAMEGPSGWIATAKGCEALEQQRIASAPLPADALRRAST